jgi:tetratricopeptide (TPR) repeat protein
VVAIVLAGAQVGAAEPPAPAVTLPRPVAALLDAGRWSEALDHLIPAFHRPESHGDLGPYIALCYQRIGQQALMDNRPVDAIDAFDRGLRFSRRDPDLHLGLGRAYLMASDYAAAEAALQDALSLRPGDPAAHRGLGQVYYLTDDAESALYHWEQAIKTGRPDPALTSRLARLRRQLAASSNLETVADHRFSIRFDGEQNPELREIVLEMLGDAAFNIGQKLNIWPNRRIGVMLLTRTAFFDITGSPGWAGGIYEGQIKAPVAGYRADLLERILHHEYVHAVLFDFLSDRCPWWLNEGMAQYFAPDPEGNRKKRGMAKQLLADGARPSLADLGRRLTDDPQSALAAYSLALSATTYLIDTFDLFRLQTLLEGLRDGMAPEAALSFAIGYSLPEFEAEWIASVRGASR